MKNYNVKEIKEMDYGKLIELINSLTPNEIIELSNQVGDIPTKVVLYRLILFFLIINIVILLIYWAIISNKKTKKDN